MFLMVLNGNNVFSICSNFSIGDNSGHCGTSCVFAIIYYCTLHCCNKGTGGHMGGLGMSINTMEGVGTYSCP